MYTHVVTLNLKITIILELKVFSEKSQTKKNSQPFDAWLTAISEFTTK